MKHSLLIAITLCLYAVAVDGQTVIVVNNAAKQQQDPQVLLNNQGQLANTEIGAAQTVAGTFQTGTCCKSTCFEAWATKPSCLVYSPTMTLPKLKNGVTHGGQTGNVTQQTLNDVTSHEDFRMTIYQTTATVVNNFAASVATTLESLCYANKDDAKTELGIAYQNFLTTQVLNAFFGIANPAQASLNNNATGEHGFVQNGVWIEPAQGALRAQISQTINNSNPDIEWVEDTNPDNKPLCQ